MARAPTYSKMRAGFHAGGPDKGTSWGREVGWETFPEAIMTSDCNVGESLSVSTGLAEMGGEMRRPE